MKQNDKYLTESLDILKRDFGQPLPTLQDTTKAHQAKKLQENPGAAAGAAMATIMLMNPQTGRKNKATTALRNKDNPSHKKAVGMFQKLRDKFKKKEDEPLSKVDQYKALMKKTTGESIIEGPDDVREARKALSRVVKEEQKFRKQMYNLEQVFLQDPRPENKKLAKEIKTSYKSGVTKFMRDSVLMVKRMK
jgi:hypothetical protein